MPRNIGAQGRPIGAFASATTLVGTTITAIAGLSISIPTVGVWKLEGYIPTVIVGLPTGFTLTVNSGPTVSGMSVLVRRYDATTAWVDSYLTAFGATSTSSTLTAQTYLFSLNGSATLTSAGTYSVSMTRTGGASATTQVGSFLLATRID